MTKSILVVEGAKSCREPAASVLARKYNVFKAKSAEETISVLNDRAHLISAVVLSLPDPTADGYSLLKMRRKNALWSRIPFIIIASGHNEQTELDALSLGANGFIAEPYRPELLLASLHNAIELCENSALTNAARRDPLTGIYLREDFFLCAREMIDKHGSGHYVLTGLDINRFQIINDQYGSEKGDSVLVSVAAILSNAVEACDGICCRISADNFAILHPRAFLGTQEHADMMQRLIHADSSVPYISFSAGFYSVNDVSLPVSAMYDRAVMAKMSIKGRYDLHTAWYEDSMREQMLHDQIIVNKMYAALEEKQFEAWFQPQYNHATGALIGAEALVRWRDPLTGSILPPAEFVPVFERNGFIYEMDKFIWRQACELLRKWIDAGYTPLPISVNISRQDVFHEDFFDVVYGLLKKYALPPELLRLEITESAFSEYPEQIVRIVKKLIAAGFEVEIDDFGSGYSSLNTLKDVPATIIKLDMRFLESSEDSQRGGNIIQSIVRMSKWLGMAVIAEGVETREQADYLKSIGCCYVQGYYYARPMPAEKYEELVCECINGEKLLVMETVENLDNNAFWDPASMDTLIFNSYVGGACIFEFHNGEVELLRVNDKFIREFGGKIPSEEVYGFKLADFLDKASMDILIGNVLHAIVSGEESTCENRVVGLYGCEKPSYIRSTVRVIAHAGERYLLYCSVINMTEQRESERKERELSSRIAAIMDNINGGVTAVVVSDSKPRMLFANDQYYAQLGFTREQFENEVSSAFELVYPEDRERVITETAQASLLRRPFSISYRIVRRDGRVRWMRSNISIAAFPDEEEPVQLAVANDISGEHENAIKMNELLNAIPGGVLIYRVEEGIELLYSSDGAAEMIGCGADEYNKRVQNGIISSIVYEEDVSSVRNQLLSAAAQNAPVNITLRLKHKNGSLVWVAFSASMIREDGKGKIYYGIFTRPGNEAVLYKSLVEDSPTAAIIMEKHNRKILYANPAWKRVQGLSEDESIVGLSLYDLVPSENVYLNDDILRELPSEFYMEFHSVSHIGKKIAVYARSLIWNGVDAYVCYISDETGLWDNCERLQDMIDNITKAEQ